MPATVIAEQAGTAPVLTARGLYHIYREGEMRTAALRGADLTLEPGSWTTVMGPSGSGKSTLLHALAGVLEPSAGSVSIDGEDVTRLRPADRARWRRQRVGVVLQRDNLHPLLDLAENVALPLRLDRRDEERHPPAGRRAAPARRAGPSGPTTGWQACRAGKGNVRRWRSPSPPARGCCSRTSRPASWTRSRPAGSWTSSTAWCATTGWPC